MNSNCLVMVLKRVAAVSGAVIAVSLLLGSGCAPHRTNGPDSAQVGVPYGADRLRVGDSLSIVFKDIPGGPQLHEVRIREDGKISVPLINEPVEAADKKTWELQEDLTALYVPNYYTRLTVIVSTDSRHVTVSGHVKAPGVVPYIGEMTVLKAVAAAGDFTDFARKKDVQVTRSDGRIFDVNCVKAIENPQLDIPVYPGDKIHVPRRFF